MPYRKTRCLTKGRREEKERNANKYSLVSHPEPAPRSLRRRISHVQTKGGYQYAD